MINTKLLAEICEVAGAPGHEQRVREIVLREIKSLVDEIKIDNMGNVVAIKKGKENKKVMIAAHMDEIGFIVTHIDDNGFIYFHTLGGFDPKTLTAQRVIIHGKKDVIGVMGSKPIHLMNAADRAKVPTIKDYFIDTGRPKKELDKIISVGDTITRERELIEMGDCLNCKSLDNRISVDFSIYQRTTNNLVVDRPLDPASGYDSTQTNVGEIVADGIELDVTLDWIRNEGDGFNWSTNFNYSSSEAIVTDLGLDTDLVPFAGFSNRGNAAIEGFSLGAMIGSAVAEDENGNFRVNGSGSYVVDNAFDFSEGSDYNNVIGDANPRI